MGAKWVVIKKGEHGSCFSAMASFSPAACIHSRTSTTPPAPGDTFAGGLAGYLAAAAGKEITFSDLRRAVVYGSVLASYNVEAFSLERLRSLDYAAIEDRYAKFKLMSHFEVLE